MPAPDQAIEAFIARWEKAEAAERLAEEDKGTIQPRRLRPRRPLRQTHQETHSGNRTDFGDAEESGAVVVMQMRKTPGVFGYQGLDYPLKEITFNAAEKATEAVDKFNSLNSLYEKTKDPADLHQLFEARKQMEYHGTIALVMAISFIDSIFYRYACFKFHPDDVKQLFKSNGFIKAWSKILEEAKGISFGKAHPTRQRLERSIEARNAIVHKKAKWITTETTEWSEEDDEWDSFKAAIVDLKPTVEACLALLDK